MSQCIVPELVLIFVIPPPLPVPMVVLLIVGFRLYPLIFAVVVVVTVIFVIIHVIGLLVVVRQLALLIFVTNVVLMVSAQLPLPISTILAVLIVVILISKLRQYSAIAIPQPLLPCSQSMLGWVISHDV